MFIDFKYRYYGDYEEHIDYGYYWAYGLLDTNDWILGQVENRIVATDYDNYALTYGCKTILGFIHFDYSTLMSREKSIQERYVTKARAVLSDIGYDLGSWISDAGECDLITEAPPSHYYDPNLEERNAKQDMLAVYERGPYFEWYQSWNAIYTNSTSEEYVTYDQQDPKTKLCYDVMSGNALDVAPHGPITGPLKWNMNKDAEGKPQKIETGFKQLLTDAPDDGEFFIFYSAILDDSDYNNVLMADIFLYAYELNETTV